MREEVLKVSKGTNSERTCQSWRRTTRRERKLILVRTFFTSLGNFSPSLSFSLSLSSFSSLFLLHVLLFFFLPFFHHLTSSSIHKFSFLSLPLSFLFLIFSFSFILLLYSFFSLFSFNLSTHSHFRSSLISLPLTASPLSSCNSFPLSLCYLNK